MNYNLINQERPLACYSTIPALEELNMTNIQGNLIVVEMKIQYNGIYTQEYLLPFSMRSIDI